MKRTSSLVVSILVAAASIVGAEDPSWSWRVVNAPGYTSSVMRDVAGGVEAGAANNGSTLEAALWTGGESSSMLVLNPDGATESEILSMDGEIMAGYAVIDGTHRAGIWTGSAESFVDLHVAGSNKTEVRGAAGSQQAGFMQTASFGLEAGFWSGTAESWTSLNPTGMDSECHDTNGTTQVGVVYDPATSWTPHATMWMGTAGSMVDLHPSAGSESYAYAVDNAGQYGTVFYGSDAHAALWAGSSASYADLHPSQVSGITRSQIFGAHGGFQVGQVAYGNITAAALWNGTAASFENLEELLPEEYSPSRAYGVYTENDYIAVVGTAFNSSTGTTQAILWEHDTYSVIFGDDFETGSTDGWSSSTQ